jgi:putative membrane protein
MTGRPACVELCTLRILRSLALSWAANAVTLVVVSFVVSGVDTGSAGDLLKASALFGVLNTVLKPVLKALTLPIAIVTLSLAWFVVAMLMLKITDWVVSGFAIHGFRALFWSTLVVWVVNVVLDFVPGPWQGTRRDRRAFARG